MNIHDLVIKYNLIESPLISNGFKWLFYYIPSYFKKDAYIISYFEVFDTIFVVKDLFADKKEYIAFSKSDVVNIEYNIKNLLKQVKLYNIKEKIKTIEKDFENDP